MKNPLIFLAGTLCIFSSVSSAEPLADAVRYKPLPGYDRFIKSSSPGVDIVSDEGSIWEYLSQDRSNSAKFQVRPVCLPVGKPKPPDLRTCIESALIKRLMEMSVTVSNQTPARVDPKAKLPTVSISGRMNMLRDAPFRPVLFEMRWIHIQSNLVLTVTTYSERTNEFMLLTNSLASMECDRGRILEAVNPEALAPFAPQDIEFEGKNMVRWLRESIGVSDTEPHRLSEAVQRQAGEAIGRISAREFDYLAELLPAAKTDHLLSEAITYAFRLTPTNGISTIPKLIELLASDEQTANRAIRCLGFIGTPSARPLLQAMSEKNPKVRERAAYALVLIQPVPEGAIPALVELMKDPDPRVREIAPGALDRIGYKPPSTK